MVPGPPAAAAESLLETQILGPYPRPTEPAALRAGAQSVWNKPSGHRVHRKRPYTRLLNILETSTWREDCVLSFLGSMEPSVQEEAEASMGHPHAGLQSLTTPEGAGGPVT